MPEVTCQVFVHERIINGEVVVYAHEPRFGVTVTGPSEIEAIERMQIHLSAVATSPRLLTCQWEFPGIPERLLETVTLTPYQDGLTRQEGEQILAVEPPEEEEFGEDPEPEDPAFAPTIPAQDDLSQYRPNQWRPEGSRAMSDEDALAICRELAQALLPHVSHILQEAQARAFLRMGDATIIASRDRLGVSRRRAPVPSAMTSRFELMNDDEEP